MRLFLPIVLLVVAPRLVHAGEPPNKNCPVRTLAYSPDGKYLAAVSWISYEPKDVGTATVWEMPSGKRVYFHEEPRGFPSATFSPDGARLALGSFTENAFIVDTASWKVERQLPGHGSSTRGVAFSPDGKTLAVATGDGSLRFWDTADWSVQKTMDNLHKGRIYAMVFTRDGKTLATAGEDRSAKLWDLQTGKELHAFKTGSVVRRILFAADERLVVYTSWDATLNIRDRDTGKELATFETGSSFDDVAVTRDGASFAYLKQGARIIRPILKAADEAAMQQLAQIMKGWDDEREGVRDQASKDIASLGIPVLGELRKLAKESPSPEVRFRARMAQAAIRSPAPVIRMIHPEGEIEALAFSPDGRTLATGGAQGTVRLWNVATGQEILLLRQQPVLTPAVPRSDY